MNRYAYRGIGWLRSLRQRFMHAAPHQYVRLSKFASRHVLFRRERRYLRGGVPSTSGKPSILFFGMNRAASMFLLESLSSLAEAHDMEPLDLVRYFVHSDRSQMRQLEDPDVAGGLFRPKGYFYGSLRGDIAIPNLGEYRTLCVVRDLRDLAVSYYYARRDAHTLTDEKFIEWRERARNATLDEHVPELAEEIAEQFREIAALRSRAPETLVCRYEDMVEDFPGWLAGVVEHLGLDEHPELVSAMIEKASFTVGEADTSSHRRSGRSGEYSHRLKAETVALLNERHGELLKQFGYAVE